MLKVVFRLHAAAGHEGVCDADGSGVSELRPDVEFIIYSSRKLLSTMWRMSCRCIH